MSTNRRQIFGTEDPSFSTPSFHRPTVTPPVIPIVVKFRTLIDLIQKFRLSESMIDSNYFLNSVDVTINDGNTGAQIPFPIGRLGGRLDSSLHLFIHLNNSFGF